MSDKFDYYDLLGVLVPGLLLICWVPFCFPEAAQLVAGTKFPEAFSVVLCTAIAVFMGHVIQALASLVEPFLYRTWGGRPSDTALAGTLSKYLPRDSAERIRKTLIEAIGREPSDRSIFLHAMQLSEGASVGRVARFNSLYAYHRSLLVLLTLGLILFLTSMIWGAARAWSWTHCIAVFVILFGLLVLFWNRTRQRACYYAREVLLTAERMHRDSAVTAAKSPKES